MKGLNVKQENKPAAIRKPKDFSYDTKYFKKHYNQMDLVFNNIKSDLQELSEYFAPRMSRFLVDDVNKPVKKPRKIRDSISIQAVNNFAAGMQSGTTSAATRWFKNQMKSKELNDIHEVKVWCSELEDLMRR
ncbi:MAG: portal protein, partial [Candidatus Gastranaerophilales bacterium]|nr:portal protein [Candidatus Gastranaerophilales bacterium]